MPINVVTIPTKLPAKCASCSCPHNRDGRTYLDFNIDVVRYGRIYLCSLCFDEIARKLDYTHMRDFEKLGKELAVADRKIAEVEDENRKLRDALSHLDFLDPVDSRDNGIQEQLVTIEGKLDELASRIPTSSEAIAGESQGDTVRSATGERNSEERKSGSVESSEISGSDGVSTAFTIDGPV